MPPMSEIDERADESITDLHEKSLLFSNTLNHVQRSLSNNVSPVMISRKNFTQHLKSAAELTPNEGLLKLCKNEIKGKKKPLLFGKIMRNPKKKKKRSSSDCKEQSMKVDGNDNSKES